MRHIEEGKALSRELGGTDEDVKQYFFDLSVSELRPILDEYEAKYGKAAREYAEATLPDWRSGDRQMGGQTASRLFRLLPSYMPATQKFSLVETLWTKFSPRSEYSIVFGRDTDANEIRKLVTDHLMATVNGHTIPEEIQHRFQWLAAGDSQCMQELLNHFLLRDRQETADAVSVEASLIIDAARSNAEMKQFQRDVKVGGHVVHVRFNLNTKKASISECRPHSDSPPVRPDDAATWIGRLIQIILCILVIYWLFFRSR